MEDLAYIYLALNNESERHQDLNEDRLPNPYAIWAPPIAAASDRDSVIASFEVLIDCDRTSVEQPDDTDSTFQPYQGFFYL